MTQLKTGFLLYFSADKKAPTSSTTAGTLPRRISAECPVELSKRTERFGFAGH